LGTGLKVLATKKRVEEEHCCDDELSTDKYLQIGTKKGRSLLAIAESPAANGWRKSGRAFYTPEDKLVPTGKNFLANLKQIDENMELGDISFTEIAKCFIANNRKQLDECAAKTWPHFISQIKLVNPKIIIILGQKTTDIFNKLAGTNLTVGKISEIELAGTKHFVLPIYHPSPANPKRALNAGIIEANLESIKKLLKTLPE